MGTRTNFYKNPSFVYNKDFNLSSVLQNLRAYNIATGNLHPTDESLPEDGPKPCRKRRRRERRAPPDGNSKVEDNDRPMSHQDYIQSRRTELEVRSSQLYEKLSADVLGSSSSVQLVSYESDESTSESEERQDSPNSGQRNEVDQIKKRSEQRFPVPGEPACVVCGKFGEYICNETDDDICSMDCKAELLKSLESPEGSLENQSLVAHSSGLVGISQKPDFGKDTWEYNDHRWSKKKTSLCTYKCWKCQRPGHLADDCLVISNPQTTSTSQIITGPNKSSSIPRYLLELYRRCNQISKNLSTTKCNTCRSSLSLTTCLDCSLVLCDSSGHLNEHIMAHPSHRQFYSHKLKRLVKCCKSTCNVTNIKDLLACQHCFDKAFDKFYDMFTATWKSAGLSIIWGSICCEDHFAWHRMNCLNANVEDSAYIVRRRAQKGNLVQLSDFIF